MIAKEILTRLQGVKPEGKGWKAKCPAHDDKSPSLSITEGSDGRALIHCHAGCKPEAICAALGLTLADLFPGTSKRNGGKGKIVATYDYRSEDGELLFQVCRFEPKDFCQRRQDATQPSGWTWKTQGVRRVLYRLPETLAAIQHGEVIHIAEGEKDVAALLANGFAATCNPGGASTGAGTRGKWRTEYSATLKGAAVVIVADKDGPGRAHAADVASKLQGMAASVKVIELPDTGGKAVKDAADYFAAGGTAADFKAVCEQAPEWTPPAQPTRTDALTTTADIRGFIVRTLLSKDATFQQRRAIADAVVSALSQAGRLFHHAELRDFETAMFFDARRKRLERIRSDAFLSWLSEWLAVNRADNLFRHIQAAVETAALSSTAASAILPATYWHATPDALYLSNGDGQLVRVTARGLELRDNGTDGVLFAAGKTLKPWNVDAIPTDPFDTCRLFRDARTAAQHGKDLLRTWLYSLPINPRCKPPLCLTGEIGSGKTRLAAGMAEFYGLPFSAQKVEESSERDFWPTLDNGGLACFDNADSRTRWLADALANAATGGGTQRRKLYENAELVTLRANAWLVVTTANPTFASDAGLADRLLVVRTHRADGDTSDAALSDEIAANRDGGLVHVAETLALALADSKPTPTGLNRRHPDFAAFAVRIGRALCREAETIAALQSAESDKSAFCLENDTIAAALLAYLSTADTFTGTAAELAPHLIAVDADLDDKLSAKRLSKRLAALWPHLAKALAVAKRETDRKGFAVFSLKAKSAEIADFQTVFS
jgi:hypothetical protein